MRILLDTCEFLWLITGDSKLPEKVASEIRNPQNQVYVSVVSFWEIFLKYSLGKLPLPDSPKVYFPLQRSKHLLESLPLDEAAVARLPDLPMLHREPFDRMLICQAQAAGLILASSDSAIRQYSVSLL